MHERIKEYLEWKATYAPRASIAYRIWLVRFVEVCGEKNITKYVVGDIVKYRHWVDARYSAYNIQFAMVVVKNFFQYFKYQNYKCLSPALIRLKRVKAKSHSAVTKEEYMAIIACISSDNFASLRDLVMVRLLWDTGVRVSELCDLEISGIGHDVSSTIISTKKTGKQRIIVWSAETHQLLMQYLDKRLELHNTGTATAALFIGYCNSKGWTARLTPRTIQRRIQFYVRRAEIKKKITPHSFRHGWAHCRRDKGAPLPFIQRGLGHVDPASSFVYQQYNDPDFVTAASAYLN